MKIGFIGLGKMGTGMARNLLRAGHDVTVYNRTREKAEALSADGAKVASSIAGAAEGAEAVFTMLADDNAAGQVVFGSGGLAEVLDKRACHISSSTLSVAFVRSLQEEHQERGQHLVSAPVFGRPDAAEAKRLVVVAAGEPVLTEKFNPLFEAIGRATFTAGSEPWQANAFKVSGNFMIASMIETFSEAFAALKKAGLDHRTFLNVIAEVFGSPVYKNYGTAIAEQQFTTPGAGFGLKLGLKDVRLASEFAHSVECPLPIANIIRDHLLSCMAHGQADMDWSSLALAMERQAGLR